MLKFTQDGKFVMQIGHSNQSKGNADTANLHRPADVWVHPQTNELYVADGYGNHRVIVYDADTGVFRRMWGAFGNKPMDDDHCEIVSPKSFPDAQGPSNLSIVHSIRVADSDGTVYVADRENWRVQVFLPDGTFVKQLIRTDIPFARNVALSPDREQQFLYVGSGKGITVVDRKTMEIVGNIQPPGIIGGGHLIATDHKGNIYIAQTSAGMQKLTFKGMTTAEPLTATRVSAGGRKSRGWRGIKRCPTDCGRADRGRGPQRADAVRWRTGSPAISAISFFTMELAERAEVLRHHHERARAADDVVAVVFLEAAGRIGVLGDARVLQLGQDRDPVDHDALGDRLIAGRLHVATRIVGAVARHVDGMPLGLVRRAGDLGGREGDAAADRGAVVERARGFINQVAEMARRIGAVDDAPIDHQLLLAGARPIDEADGDLLVGAGFDRLQHLRIGDGGRVALALQQEFRLLHAARHVHRQSEQQIDLLGGARMSDLT